MISKAGGRVALMAAAAIGTLAASGAALGSERVSVATGGAQGNDGSYNAATSEDGRYVVFESDASNLVAGDTNDRGDIFVRDRQTGETERVSVSSAGAQADDYSFNARIAAFGRYVIFASAATNLVAGDDNGEIDLFLRDLQTDQTERISVSTAGAQANGRSVIGSISGDGSRIAFQSYASNLVSGDTNDDPDVFVRDRALGETIRVSTKNGTQVNGDWGSTSPAISRNGLLVVWASKDALVDDDTNGVYDIFMHSASSESGATTRMSVGDDESQGTSDSVGPSISFDGEFVAFTSSSPNLVTGDGNGVNDVFVRARIPGDTRRVSVDTAGGDPDGSSGGAHISRDGRWIAFGSVATDLVTGDSNGHEDAFVYDTASSTTRLASESRLGVQGNDDTYPTWLSGDGRYVAMESYATNLAAGDTNDGADIYVRDLERVAPETTITSGPGTTGDSTPSFGFTSDEAGSDFECRVDAGAWTPCASPHEVPALSAGEHLFEVRARDLAGNQDATPAARAVYYATFPSAMGRIAFTRGGASDQVVAMNGDGSLQTPLRDGTAPAYSADGSKLAFEAGSGLSRMAADGTGLVAVTSDGDDADPSWSPNGQLLAFTRFECDATFTFCGRSLYTASATDGATVTRIVDGRNGASEIAEPDFAPDGSKLAATRVGFGSSGPSSVVVAMNPNGSGESPLAGSPGDDSDPAYSPDGSKIAFTGFGGGDNEIWVMDSDGTDAVQLTTNNADDREPTWSPSGHRIAFTSNRDGDDEIWSIRPDGSQALQLTNNSVADREPDWGAPDGSVANLTLNGPSGTTSDPTPEFTFGAAEVAAFECRVDTAAFGACASPFTTAALADGAHRFEVRATDIAGNTATAGHDFTVSTAPPPPVEQPPVDPTPTGEDPPPSDPPSEPPPGTGSDTTPPAPSEIPDGKTGATKNGKVSIDVACPAQDDGDECAGEIAFETKRKFEVGNKKRRLKLGEIEFALEPGESGRFVFRIPKKMLKALEGLDKVTVMAEVTTVDDAGNTVITVETLVIELRRR